MPTFSGIIRCRKDLSDVPTCCILFHKSMRLLVLSFDLCYYFIYLESTVLEITANLVSFDHADGKKQSQVAFPLNWLYKGNDN